jgi:hypothetical protein
MKECDISKIQLHIVRKSSNNVWHIITKTITTLQHSATLHHTSPNYTSPHFTQLHFTQLHFTTIRRTLRHFTQLHFTTLHFNTLIDTSLHLIYTSLPSHLALRIHILYRSISLCFLSFYGYWRYLPWINSSRYVDLIIYAYLFPRLRKSGFMIPLFYIFSWRPQGFYLYLYLGNK